MIDVMNKLVVGAIAVIIATGTGSLLLSTPASTGATDTPVTTELDKQQSQLDNHEARITNSENNIKDLQASTGTPSSSQQVVVPSAMPSPTTVTVTSFKEVVIALGTSDCQLTYSDNTSYQLHWKTTNPQGSWVTDSQGQNGHWVPITTTVGVCDQSVIDTAKN